MTRRYVITTPANTDLEDILRRIAYLSSFDKSDRFLTRFSEKLKKSSPSQILENLAQNGEPITAVSFWMIT